MLTIPKRDPVVSSDRGGQRQRVHRLLAQLAHPGDSQRLTGLLEEMQRILTPYFAASRRPGGLYEQLLSRAPHCTMQVRQLTRGQQRLLRELWSLARTARDGRFGIADLPRARVQGWVAALRRHERREAACVADVYWSDIGVGD